MTLRTTAVYCIAGMGWQPRVGQRSGAGLWCYVTGCNNHWDTRNITAVVVAIWQDDGGHRWTTIVRYGNDRSLGHTL